jgi:TldD protein
MDPAISSLSDRAGLDRAKVRQLIGRGLEGADDGELFLEYRQAEALTFDNGRLKQATYDTAQGFGLRAVRDEAVGYAHASDLSDGAIARSRWGTRSQHDTAAPPRHRAAPTANFIPTTIRSARRPSMQK